MSPEEIALLENKLHNLQEELRECKQALKMQTILNAQPIYKDAQIAFTMYVSVKELQLNRHKPEFACFLAKTFLNLLEDLLNGNICPSQNSRNEDSSHSTPKRKETSNKI